MSHDTAPNGPNEVAEAAYAAAGGPALDFTTLVLSVHESALISLGVKEPSDAGVDLEGARTQIDLLGVLSAKTRGNLTPEEERLLRGVLYELQVAYVDRAQRGP